MLDLSHFLYIGMTLAILSVLGTTLWEKINWINNIMGQLFHQQLPLPNEDQYCQDQEILLFLNLCIIWKISSLVTGVQNRLSLTAWQVKISTVCSKSIVIIGIEFSLNIFTNGTKIFIKRVTHHLIITYIFAIKQWLRYVVLTFIFTERSNGR